MNAYWRRAIFASERLHFFYRERRLKAVISDTNMSPSFGEVAVEKHWPMWLYTVHLSGDAPEAGQEAAPGHVTVLPQIRHTFLVWASNRRRLFLPRVFQWPHHTVLGEDRQTGRQTHGLEGWDCSPVVPPPGKHSHQRHILLRTKPRPGYWRESGVNTGHSRIDQTLGDQSSGGFRAEATGVIC